MIKERGLEILFTKEEIQRKVSDLAIQIHEDYAEKEPVFVGVLKGSFIFLADLIRALDTSSELDFIWMSSYGMEKYSSGEVRIRKDLEISISGRDVLIVEDIVDTGVTLSFIMDHLERRHPSSLKVCSLIDKRETRMVPVEIDYVGFLVESGFLVGYGLDFGERYRAFPDIYLMGSDHANLLK